LSEGSRYLLQQAKHLQEIKKWRREKKNNLVAAVNPEWKDLSNERV